MTARPRARPQRQHCVQEPSAAVIEPVTDARARSRVSTSIATDPQPLRYLNFLRSRADTDPCRWRRKNASCRSNGESKSWQQRRSQSHWRHSQWRPWLHWFRRQLMVIVRRFRSRQSKRRTRCSLSLSPDHQLCGRKFSPTTRMALNSDVVGMQIGHDKKFGIGEEELLIRFRRMPR